MSSLPPSKECDRDILNLREFIPPGKGYTLGLHRINGLGLYGEYRRAISFSL